jgi:hypothetical protein
LPSVSPTADLAVATSNTTVLYLTIG